MRYLNFGDIHERVLRLVYQDYTSTFEQLLKKDGSLTFHHRNIHHVAIEMFKVKHDLSPPFMKEIFSPKVNEKGTRSGDTFERPNVESVKKGIGLYVALAQLSGMKCCQASLKSVTVYLNLKILSNLGLQTVAGVNYVRHMCLG